MSTYKCRVIRYKVYIMYRTEIGTLQIRRHIRSVEIPDFEITSVDCTMFMIFYSTTFKMFTIRFILLVKNEKFKFKHDFITQNTTRN